ncbi:MAG: phage tail protein [Frankiales bacterium]|nr:phage tail protein [Frankiales bacterium]
MDPFVAEIRIFAGNFPPTGWALCNGQLMPISQNTALFSLLGTTYGGDGTTNFALPDLQNRIPMHPGQGPGLSLRSLGESGGADTVTLLTSELPAHTHGVSAVADAGDTTDPTNAAFGEALHGRVAANLYSTATPADVPMGAGAAVPAGGGQPHNNLPPYLELTYIIALQGVFPPRQ